MTPTRFLPSLLLGAGFFVAVSAVAAAPAAARPAPVVHPMSPDVVSKMSALFAKASPAVREWVDVEARKLRPMPKIDLFMVAADARQRFTSAVPTLTPAQADLLAAMALYQTAKDLESTLVIRDHLKDSKDSLNEMGKQDALLLQQMMEKKAQLETMISRVMRSSYDAGQAAIAALKSS